MQEKRRIRFVLTGYFLTLKHKTNEALKNFEILQTCTDVNDESKCLFFFGSQ